MRGREIQARAKAQFQTSCSVAEHRSELEVNTAKEKAEAERDPASEAMMKRLEELTE